MELRDIQHEWYVVHAMDFFHSYNPKAKRFGFEPGAKGYARRNVHHTLCPTNCKAHDYRYFMVVINTSDGSICGFYIHEDTAVNILIPVKPSPVNARPQEHWQNFWRSSFMK